MQTVLIVDDPSDVCTDAVVESLASTKVAVFRVDAGDFPQDLSLSVRTASDGWVGCLELGDRTLRLDAVSAVYYNRPTQFRLPESLSGPERDFCYEEARAGFGGVLLSLQCKWMNHPSRNAKAEYKPLQLAVAGGAGFMIPRTVITNEPGEALRFLKEIPEGVVCKPLRLGSISESSDFFLVGTSKLSEEDLETIERVQTTAHLFQEWVDKKFDVRTTVVGDTIFSVAIYAETPETRIDWRRDYAKLRYEIIDTPQPISQAIHHYMESFGLSYGAFDFSVNQDHQWIFLECNPSGR